MKSFYPILRTLATKVVRDYRSKKKNEDKVANLRSGVYGLMKALGLSTYTVIVNGERYNVEAVEPSKRIHIPATQEILDLLEKNGLEYKTVNVSAHIRIHSDKEL